MFAKEDVITTDGYLAAFPESYYKMDAIQQGIPIFWRGRMHSPPQRTAQTIVSGHSDYPITDQLTSHYPRALWFGVNNQSSRAIGIPLGTTNNTDESDVHPIYGNIDVMVDVVKVPRNIQNLVYMNFSVSTYPDERGHVWEMFREKDWVTVGETFASLEGRKTFLTEMRNHSYVLCPRGNGIDTHRLWEALYMGSIPIVIWDLAHSGWTDLPILFVKSWEDVTEEMLRRELPRMQNTAWNMQKLHVGYWINRIRNENRNRARRNGYQSPLLRIHP